MRGKGKSPGIVFTPWSEKSPEEREAIKTRNAKGDEGIRAAEAFLRAHPIVRDRAMALSKRSLHFSNEDWPHELTLEWRSLKVLMVELFEKSEHFSDFLGPDVSDEDRTAYFQYGLQFLGGKLSRGTFDFDSSD